MLGLPPLRALRAYEACFRYNSFTKAASSLNVGQPAISHQIRALEKDLNVRLFKKHGAQIEPTAEARSYYASIQPALQTIADATRQLRGSGDFRGVQIGSYPGLATYWLAPRLAQLSRAHPDAGVRLITAELDRDLSLDGLDCAILFGNGDWPQTQSVSLIPEEVIPVCSPALYEAWSDKSAEELITKAPLIELADQEDRWHNWKSWKEELGITTESAPPALVVYNHALALNQALTGQGIALAWKGVVNQMLDEGLLKALPFPYVRSERGYFLVARAGFLESKAGQILLKFLT